MLVFKLINFFGVVLCLFDLEGSCRRAKRPAWPGLTLEREGGGEFQASDPLNICFAEMETTEASSRPLLGERQPGWKDEDIPTWSVPVRSHPNGCGFAAGMCPVPGVSPLESQLCGWNSRARSASVPPSRHPSFPASANTPEKKGKLLPVHGLK